MKLFKRRKKRVRNSDVLKAVEELQEMILNLPEQIIETINKPNNRRDRFNHRLEKTLDIIAHEVGLE